jgi:hypothetical protein
MTHTRGPSKVKPNLFQFVTSPVKELWYFMHEYFGCKTIPHDLEAFAQARPQICTRAYMVRCGYHALYAYAIKTGGRAASALRRIVQRST